MQHSCNQLRHWGAIVSAKIFAVAGMTAAALREGCHHVVLTFEIHSRAPAQDDRKVAHYHKQQSYRNYYPPSGCTTVPSARNSPEKLLGQSSSVPGGRKASRRKDRLVPASIRASEREPRCTFTFGMPDHVSRENRCA